MLQALDVTAETDGRSPQRTEYRPFGSGSALGQAWPAIGAVALLLVILGGCLVWHWRRRSRRLQRICDAILERCRRCRQGSNRYPSTVRLASLSMHWFCSCYAFDSLIRVTVSLLIDPQHLQESISRADAMDRLQSAMMLHARCKL